MNENEDQPPKHRPWLERITSALMRDPQNREELVQLLRDAKQRDVIDVDTLKMIEGVLKVNEMKVRDIMISRAQMVTIPENFTTKQAVPQMIDSAHSRYPVVSEDGDKIIGILLAKDLLKYVLTEHADNIQIRQLIRPAIFIPESKRLNILLREFRLNRNHIAIVIDEYGAIAGLITIEDVLEVIVGAIEDEYDVAEEPHIRAENNESYMVDALTPVPEFNEFFNTNFNEDEVDTIGGLILQQLSHLPQKGEKIELGPFLFTVIEASNRGINTLNLVRKKIEQQKEE